MAVSVHQQAQHILTNHFRHKSTDPRHSDDLLFSIYHCREHHTAPYRAGLGNGRVGFAVSVMGDSNGSTSEARLARYTGEAKKTPLFAMGVIAARLSGVTIMMM